MLHYIQNTPSHVPGDKIKDSHCKLYLDINKRKERLHETVAAALQEDNIEPFKEFAKLNSICMYRGDLHTNFALLHTTISGQIDFRTLCVKLLL